MKEALASPKDAALKLALEALELHGQQYPHMVKGYCLDAITAIKEALAQPAQEPVAWVNVEKRKLEWAKPMSWNTPTIVNVEPIPLYTTPQQRTWVGLTDEEKLVANQMWRVMDADGFIKAIEAKLKEKNI